jgi:hypothetical protein
MRGVRVAKKWRGLLEKYSNLRGGIAIGVAMIEDSDMWVTLYLYRD